MKKQDNNSNLMINITGEPLDNGEFSVRVFGSVGSHPLKGKDIQKIIESISQFDFSNLDGLEPCMKPGRYIGTDPDVHSSYMRRLTILEEGLSDDQFSYIFDGEDEVHVGSSKTIFSSSLTEVRS